MKLFIVIIFVWNIFNDETKDSSKQSHFFLPKFSSFLNCLLALLASQKCLFELTHFWNWDFLKETTKSNERTSNSKTGVIKTRVIKTDLQKELFPPSLCLALLMFIVGNANNENGVKSLVVSTNLHSFWTYIKRHSFFDVPDFDELLDISIFCKKRPSFFRCSWFGYLYQTTQLFWMFLMITWMLPCSIVAFSQFDVIVFFVTGFCKLENFTRLRS